VERHSPKPALTCKVDGCEKRSYGHGRCQRHWHQVLRFGKVQEHTTRDPRPAIIEGNIAKIPLGVGAKDGYAIVDKEWAWIDKFKWVRHKKGPRSIGYYAAGTIDPTASRAPTLMHRFIANTPDGFDTDHRDGDGLNNRLSNLRRVNRPQNNYNTGIWQTNTSGYKGVSWSKVMRKWRAYIGGAGRNGNRRELGYFDDINDAVKARAAAEKETIVPA
jgi:HNH endonuclease